MFNESYTDAIILLIIGILFIARFILKKVTYDMYEILTLVGSILIFLRAVRKLYFNKDFRNVILKHKFQKIQR